MSNNHSFLQAILTEPDNDTPRLIYADWLEENGEPERAEFIRLQVELEPLRIPTSDPEAELERHRRLHRIPPGKAEPWEEWIVGKSLKREEDLLFQFRKRWLGPAVELWEDYQTHFNPEFRRGFVESVGVGLTALVDQGQKIHDGCPMLRELIVYGSMGRGKQLASCAAVAGVPRIVIAGWVTVEDASALLNSPHFSNLRSLTVYIEAEGDPRAVRMLARLPRLYDLRLVQVWGGIEADNPQELDDQAIRLVALIRKDQPELKIHLERPFARRFPLDGINIGHGIDAGYLPDGQAVLIWESKLTLVMYFDEGGHFVREEQLDLSQKLVKPPVYSWEDCDAEELIQVLGDEIGFTAGPIFVREFFSESTDIGVMCWDSNMVEEVGWPGPRSPEFDEESGAEIYRWWNTFQFALPFGNYYWADGLGQIHTS